LHRVDPIRVEKGAPSLGSMSRQRAGHDEDVLFIGLVDSQYSEQLMPGKAKLGNMRRRRAIGA